MKVQVASIRNIARYIRIRKVFKKVFYAECESILKSDLEFLIFDKNYPDESDFGGLLFPPLITFLSLVWNT